MYLNCAVCQCDQLDEGGTYDRSARVGEKRIPCRILEGKLESDDLEDVLRLGGVKIDLSKGGWKAADRIHPARDWNRWWAVVKAVMNRLVISDNSVAE